MDPEFGQWFSTPQVSCSHHPDREATVACARCGGFQCVECVDREQQKLCEGCAAAVTRDRIPAVVRGVVWKLMLAPSFAIATAGWVVAHHGQPSPSLLVWLVPIICASALLLSERAIFGFLGVAASLAVLGWQASGAESWVLLSDVAFLAIAPAAALLGCVSLARAHRRVEFVVA